MNYATLPIKYLENRRKDAIEIEIEESTGFCARIKTKSGNHFFIGADLGVNSSSSNRISDDKLYSYYFLEKDGVNTIKSFGIEEKCDLLDNRLSFPFIIKPNKGLGGDGFLIISSKEEIEKAFVYTSKFTDMLIAQEYINKREFRIVVFNGELYFAYERTKYEITGDGESTIKNIINERNSKYRDTQKIDLSDFRLEFELNKCGLNLDSILEEGRKVHPFGNSNLKCGGDWNDVTNLIHKSYVEVACKCAESLGLKIAGIDIFCDSIIEFDEEYSVIEVNSSPGFEYIRSDKEVLNRLFEDIVSYLK